MLKTIIILILTIVVLPLVALKLDPNPLSALQLSMLKTSFFIALAFGMLCFIVSEATGNCSQTDKIWSITPIVYSWYFATATQFDARITLMACCVTIWGARLTYNFSRRGAYRLKFWTGEEDYRWEVLRQNPLFKNKPLNWKLFNFFFISMYQNMLLWLLCLPAVFAYSEKKLPLSGRDIFIALLFFIFIIIETIADQQQWNFQQQKRKAKGAEANVGFVHTGLWAFVRHPNYACEQAIWIVFYFFSVVATGSFINWSMAGCLLLLILFQGSSDFSEGISLTKYPAYKDYIKNVPRFLPRLKRRIFYLRNQND